MNNHFGFALGAITATVIGGAVLLDHTLKPAEKAPSVASKAAESTVPAPAVASADSTPAAADTRSVLEDGSKVTPASTPPQVTEPEKATPAPAKKVTVAAPAPKPIPQKPAEKTAPPVEPLPPIVEKPIAEKPAVEPPVTDPPEIPVPKKPE